MLWTLLSGALRRGAGQLRITWLPRCTPDNSSVRCGTFSTGGSGGLRLPHVGAKDSADTANNRMRNDREPSWPGRERDKGMGTRVGKKKRRSLQNVAAQVLILNCF